MLSEFDYTFIYEGNDFFDSEISNIDKDERSYAEAIIICFYRDKSNNIVKVVKGKDKTDNDISVDGMELLSKYYITRIGHNYEKYFDDGFTAATIYNIGDFKISEISNEETSKEVIEMFKKYDDSFDTMKVPFTDEEYLEGNTKKIGKEYNGLPFR